MLTLFTLVHQHVLQQDWGKICCLCNMLDMTLWVQECFASGC